jgi:ABC-2 type transport system ATP-binding protein
MEPAIEARGLRKEYRGGVEALRGLDLSVRKGAVYGLVGRNGAGKTTTIRCLLGLLHPTAGEARVLGMDLRRAPPAERARVAYVSQEGRLPVNMTLEVLCRYLSHFYERWDAGRAEALAGRFGLDPRRLVETLSGGEKRKVSILAALAARPDVLLLDEPAAGLDPIARRELLDALVEALEEGDGLTVLLSTHILSDIERLAEDVGVIHEGRMVLSGSLEEIQGGTRLVQVIFEGEAVPKGVHLPGTIREEVAGPVLKAIVRPYDEEAVRGAVVGLPARLQAFPLGLEDLFVSLLGRGTNGESGNGGRDA